jgi:hypothetical protein
MTLLSATFAASAFLGACSSSSGPSSTGRQVAFQLATRTATAAPSNAALLAGQEVIGLGSDTIVLSSVQFVLRKIELQRAVAAPVCDSLTTDDDCEELKVGPVLLDLPLGAGASRAFNVAIDTGSYGKIKLEIHKPSGSEVPGFDGVSIRVVGTYNGTPFTFESDLDAEQEFTFNPPLTVTDSTGAHLTLFVDLAKWFDNGNAGSPGLIDPTSATIGGPNEGVVKNAIEASLNAFEDENHNGEDDHHES